MKKNRFPEELSLTEADKFEFFEGFEDLTKAKAYAKKKKGQLYTQVDCESSLSKDNQDVCYLKGNHFVNRTGYYIVVMRF